MDTVRARRERTSLKGRLTRLEKKLYDLIKQPRSFENIQMAIVLTDQAQEIWHKYETIQQEMVIHVDEEQMETEQTDFEKIEEQFINMKSECQRYTNRSSSSSQTTSSRASNTLKNSTISKEKSTSFMGSVFNAVKSKLVKPQQDKIGSGKLSRTSSSKSSDFHGFSSRKNSTMITQVPTSNPQRNVQDWLRNTNTVRKNPLPFNRENNQSWDLGGPTPNPPQVVQPTIQQNDIPTVVNKPIFSNLRNENHTNQNSNINTGDFKKIIEALSSNITSQSLLPQLPTLKFSGEGVDWPEFRDIFQGVSSKLQNDMDRLTFLKMACKDGEADRLVKFYNTANEFRLAWDSLVSEYDQEKLTIVAHIKKFLHQKPIMDKSPTSLKSLHTTSDTVVRQLQALNYINRDLWLITILVEKLDQQTAQAWSIHSSQIKLPTMTEFLKFLSNRCKALEINSTPSSKQTKSSSSTSDTQKSQRFRSHHTNTGNKQKTSGQPSSSNVKCYKCSAPHYLNQCPSFNSLTPNQRVDFVKSNCLCINCFRKHDNGQHCNSRFTCKHCQQHHHSLLHDATNIQTTIVSNVANLLDLATNSLLPTAIVNIVANGLAVKTRIIIDTASTVTLISESVVQLLKLNRRNYSTSVIGSGNTVTCTTKGIVNINVQSVLDPSKEIAVEAVILQKVSGKSPAAKLNTSTWSHLQDLSLADPTFMNPGNVDIILGAQHFIEILEPTYIKGPPGTPDALNTIFGWVVLGDPGEQSQIISAHTHVSLHNHLQIDSLLRKFWEVEEIPATHQLSDEEQAAEDHFVRNTIRTSEGRFQVKLPFKFDKQPLGNSFKSAIAQALSEERRCDKNPIYKQLFHEFMEDINTRNHWELVPESEIAVPDDQCYYMKRHGVLKESSTTTKLRVVVNASSQTANGVSLNDNLMTGPKVQRDLLDIMLRHRTYPFVFTADIEKMYRMVQLSKPDSNYQRMLYRKSKDEPFNHYRLTTVIYGTRSAPFQATRALVECAHIYQQQFPEASEALLNDTYVDDVTSGSYDLNQCKKKMMDLKTILAKCGFILRKWSANDPRLLTDIPSNEIEINLLELGADEEAELKILGIWYDAKTDVYKYKVNIQPSPNATRRNMLSELSRIFDPFGIVQPVTIIGKILMQSVWQLGTGWDDPLPVEIVQLWVRLCNEFQLLNEITVPRYIPNINGTINLYGFSDASEKAYCAVVYAFVVNEDGITVGNIIASKTKVAPVKPLSIARLELCAAAELAKLIAYLRNSFHHLKTEVYAFTDSTTVMAWLSQTPRKWKTFVAHRVSSVIEVIPPDRWWHIPGNENPADIGSRGLYPSELLDNDIWFKGPKWLYESNDQWPISRSTDSSTAASELNNRFFCKFITQRNLTRTFFNPYCHCRQNIIKLSRLWPLYFEQQATSNARIGFCSTSNQ